MNTQKYRTNYQKGGATRKVFKISVDKKSLPPIITVNNVDSSATLNDGVTFDDFYKSYVDKSQDSKSMYIAVNISDDNKIENFDIKDINSNDNTDVGVIVQTPGTQSSAANSSANAIGVNQQGDATKTENQQVDTTNYVEQQVEANQSDKQQGKSDNQLVGVTNSVDKQGDNTNSVDEQGDNATSVDEQGDNATFVEKPADATISGNPSKTRIKFLDSVKKQIATNKLTGPKNGGKRNLTKRRKRRHSRK